jgi:hypothetical protein
MDYRKQKRFRQCALIGGVAVLFVPAVAFLYVLQAV